MAFNPNAFNPKAYRTPWLLGKLKAGLSRVVYATSSLVAEAKATTSIVRVTRNAADIGSTKAIGYLVRREKSSGEIERE